MRLLIALLLSIPAVAATPVRVLIVDGINNHDWQAATAFLKSVLGSTGRFQVDVSTCPPKESMADWRPGFKNYDVVIQNFNGGHREDGVRWPESVEREFLDFVRKGGGVVIFHAANNAFLKWPEYNELVGLLWRDKSFGPGLVIDIAKKPMMIPAGEGLNPGHGPRHDCRIDVLDVEHPVTRGMPRSWQHRAEQLTHGQHGPASAMKHLRILTYAYSKDSKRNEPMDWVRRYGKGRVYTTMLGHTWRNEVNPNLDVPEFRRMLARAVEWAGTGKVTLPAN
ncbi:MAG: ThuA domain-containing protein [Acidobacteria bacterium]|nr:ThuA domain-containing protein [Acidobacteriota bacterium]